MNEQDFGKQAFPTADKAQSQEVLQSVELVDGVQIASDEEVRRASEKVFRLHARLFEALAK